MGRVGNVQSDAKQKAEALATITRKGLQSS